MNSTSEMPRGTRRVVYNSDPSNTLCHYSDPTKPEELRQWVGHLAAHRVDTYVQEVFHQAWTHFFRSERCDYDARPHHRRFIPMMDAGIMPLDILIEETHKKGMEFVAGFRMNDRHGHNKEFMDKHQQWVLKEFGYGVDFSHPEVRDWMLAILEEVANRFDVDGLELNFIRHCHCFPTAMAKECHPMMTDFLKRIRAMLDGAGAKKNRQLLLGVRVPQTLAECYNLGYDAPTWVNEGLIDYLCPCDFFYPDFNAQYEEFSQLTRASNCLLYPTIQPLICNKNEVGLMKSENYRALVKNFYGAGADGFSVHNYQYHWAMMAKNIHPNLPDNAYPGPVDMFPKALAYFQELRDPQTVAAGDRHYLFYPLWGGESPSGAIKNDRVVLKKSQPHKREEYRFRICENLRESGTKARLTFNAIGLAAADEIAVDINGTPIPSNQIERTPHEKGRTEQQGRPLPPYASCQFALTEPPTTYGDNQLGLTLLKSAPEAKEELVIDEVEVIVKVE